MLEKLQQAFDLLQEVNDEMDESANAWEFLQRTLTNLDRTMDVFDRFDTE